MRAPFRRLVASVVALDLSFGHRAGCRCAAVVVIVFSIVVPPSQRVRWTPFAGQAESRANFAVVHF